MSSELTSRDKHSGLSIMVSRGAFGTLVATVVLVAAYQVIANTLPSETDLPLQFQAWTLLCAVVVSLAFLIGMPFWMLTVSRLKDLRESKEWTGWFKVELIMAFVLITVAIAFAELLFTSNAVYTYSAPVACAAGPCKASTAPQSVMRWLIAICYFGVALPSALWATVSVKCFSRIDEATAKGPADAAIEFQELRAEAQLVGTLSAIGIAALTLPLGA